MRVSVIGGGAIGLLICYFLKKNHHDPVLYTRTVEQAKTINQKGLTYIDKFDNGETVFFEAKSVKDFKGSEEFGVVTVTQNAIKDMRFLNQESFKGMNLLFLQNGIGHIEWLNSLPQENISVGVVEHGAMKEGFAAVRHVGTGKIKVSEFKGRSAPDWQRFIFPEECFPVIMEKDWEMMLYKKLIMNASINPVTAMLGIPNGQLIENDYAHKMMKQLFEESVSALDMNEIKSTLWKELSNLCRTTSLNRSSMLKSIESGKETEIDGITGEIIKHADRKNLKVPVSRFVYYAVKVLESR
ncbi:ketopantoate reductase family protein [Fictibacillus barbaricus]|uniref:2-dehydropantoate 2-reductase n=1 Tax=Fictibacillus barbaricus TaxID=182136 RepID=A0ABU1U4T5_9BACL|nr:2-dehydropantoate 2-reductase [Fictibacillus barbaricus]MDR7074463.1 2-dehydropantoate 2-reductase [Fictibacillus barbaricus]